MRNWPVVYFGGEPKGVVINLGKISSSGGDVLLIAGKKVVNAGEIRADNGSVEMATGSYGIILTGYDNSGQQVSVETGSAGTVVNAGVVRAAQINLQAVDGNIYALAGQRRELRATGVSERYGQIWLVAQNGKVDARGASFTAHEQDGTYGSVEMRAADLKVEGAQVHAGDWTLAANAMTIGRPLARTFTRALSSGTSVYIDTANSAHGSGDIDVRENLRWKGDASLSLNAGHSVTIARGVTIANEGGGSLSLTADGNGVTNGGSVVNGGALDWCRSTGTVTILYDRNGRYLPGVQRANPSWHANAQASVDPQIMAWSRVDTWADFEAMNSNLNANYRASGSLIYGGTHRLSRPIGSAAHPFTGVFEGAGSMLFVDVQNGSRDPDSADTGMFGVIGRGGVVRNFGVEGTSDGAAGATGLIAGRNDGLILDVGAYGDVRGGGPSGGIAGVNRGLILDASYQPSGFGSGVRGDGPVGGIAGVNLGTIARSSASSDVGGYVVAPVGGVAGVNRGRIIESSYRNEDGLYTVSGSRALGGLAGINTGFIAASYTDAALDSQSTGPVGRFSGVNTGRIAADNVWGGDPSVPQTKAGNDN